MAPAFTLFTHPQTPNGFKVSLFLEELKAAYPKTMPEYKTVHIAMYRLEHREPWYLKINPNGKVPALVHHRPNGRDHAVFESTAMIVYLAQHFDPQRKPVFRSSVRLRVGMHAMDPWGHGDLGPIQGLAGQFLSHPSAEVAYAIKRFVGKTKRMYTMVNDRLEGRDWLVGPGRGMLSIADLSIFPWISGHSWAGIESLGTYPNVKRWQRALASSPGVRRAMMAGSDEDSEEESSDLEA